MQNRLHLDNHKLIQDIQTRWNSTYLMFERIIEQNEAITTALCLLSRNDLCLTESEISTLREAIAILKPFEAATKEMSADQYISLSKIIPMSKSLQQLTVAACASATSTISLGQHLISLIS